MVDRRIQTRVWILVESNKWLNIDHSYLLARHLALARTWTGWLSVTEWNIRSWCWWPRLLGAQYKGHRECILSFSFFEDLYCLSRICLISLVFTIRRKMRNRKPEPTLLPTWGIFNLPDHIDMVWEKLAFDDVISYPQWLKSKLAEVMAWGIAMRIIR